METWQILSGITMPVLGYLTLSNIQQGKQIAVMSKQLDNLQNQINLFLKTEVDTLQSIVRELANKK